MKIPEANSFTKNFTIRTTKRRMRLQDQSRAAPEVLRNDLNPNLTLVDLPIGDLKFPNRRVRRASAAQVERLKKSIQHFGFVHPILITVGRSVVDGENRVEAARLLGCETVPCIIVDHLSNEQIRLLRVTLNRLQEQGEWDFDALRLEFLDLIDLELDLSVTGFSPQELDIICLDDQPVEAPSSTDLEPDRDEPPVSELGDIWLLDNHRLICGDALLPETYETLMAGAGAQAIFSDPPYNVKIEGFVSSKTAKHAHKDFVMAAGEMSKVEFGTFLQNFLEHSAAHVTDGGVMFFCSDWRCLAQLHAAFEAVNLHLINVAVWDKGTGGMGSLYRSQHELVSICVRGKSPGINNVELGKHGRNRSNVWSYPGANRLGSSANKALKLHPTPKPVEMVVDALLDVTNKGDIVLDPFMGSGTTIIAADKAKRIAYGVELDPQYVDVAVRRWQGHSGKPAIHAESGISFDEVARQRLDDQSDNDNQGDDND